MRSIVPWALAVSLAAAGGARAQAPAPAPELATDEQKTFYALGLLLGQNLANYSLTEPEMELVRLGIADGALKREPRVDQQAFLPKVRELQASRARQRAEVEKRAGQEYLSKAAGEPGATRTASGLIFTTVQEGSGPMPTAADKVRVHYTGRLIDGTVFDSSVQRNQPATFPLNGVIRCWTEALQLMKAGGKSRLVCPSDLAYGDRGAPPRIPPGATLVFEVELLEIVK
jgi:FKBP-type peptidyl-prolyl cis-trans isomerase FkpA/FKBP-type peptidyl-prolyl cis-trans isomerase FklB